MCEELPERMSVEETASRLKCSLQCIREMIKRGKVPWGFALESETGSTWNYFIFRKRFEAYLRGELS